MVASKAPLEHIGYINGLADKNHFYLFSIQCRIDQYREWIHVSIFKMQFSSVSSNLLFVEYRFQILVWTSGEDTCRPTDYFPEKCYNRIIVHFIK